MFTPGPPHYLELERASFALNIYVIFVTKMDPTYPLVPIANFFACALSVIPLFHMVNRSWNTGVYVFALWLLLISLTNAIDTIIWSNDTNDRAPVWCDISKSANYLLNVMEC